MQEDSPSLTLSYAAFLNSSMFAYCCISPQRSSRTRSRSRINRRGHANSVLLTLVAASSHSIALARMPIQWKMPEAKDRLLSAVIGASANVRSHQPSLSLEHTLTPSSWTSTRLPASSVKAPPMTLSRASCERPRSWPTSSRRRLLVARVLLWRLRDRRRPRLCQARQKLVSLSLS